MSVFAGVTTFLSNYILRIVLLLFSNVDYVKSASILDDPIGSIVNIGLMIMLNFNDFCWRIFMGNACSNS